MDNFMMERMSFALVNARIPFAFYVIQGMLKFKVLVPSCDNRITIFVQDGSYVVLYPHPQYPKNVHERVRIVIKDRNAIINLVRKVRLS